MSRLSEKIKEQIKQRGKITFAEFMELALYHPEFGYYTSPRQRVGANGDFYTSPATHPVFAAFIAIQMEQMWQLLGRPPEFTTVEMGAGKGLLARDIIDYLPHLSPDFTRMVQYITTERNSITLYRHDSQQATRMETGKLPDSICGCFLSNELLDALPTHRVIMRDGHLNEIYVTLDGDNFVEVTGPPSTPELEIQLIREGITLPENYHAEVNLKTGPLFSDIAARLKKGFVITIDYGYPAAELYAPERSSGTLVTYYRHTCGSDPYVRIGSQDITSHVNFTTAILAGESRGLQTLALIRQRDFLTNLGIHAFLDALTRRGLNYNEYLANRYAMLELIREEGMGSFKVLLQSKGVEEAPLYGITPDNEIKKASKAKQKSPPVPLLDGEHIPLLTGKYPHQLGIDDDLW